jgi:uncharacterized membrane protein
MYKRLAAALLAILFAVNVYRAGSQSITSDEAFAVSLFLEGKWSQLVRSYDASHHVLHTYLCKLTTAALGLSEFSLRLPSLLAGALYLAMALRLSRRLFGERRLFLFSTALLALNPLVLDFLSAARGYGLALALFLYALDQTLQWMGGELPPERLWRAGGGLGLSVAANLTLLVPAAALAVIVAALAARRGLWRAAIDSFAVPGIVVCFLLVVFPLSWARRDNFYVGLASLADSVKDLTAFSLYHHPLEGPRAAWVPPSSVWFAILGILAPALLTAAAAAAAALCYRLSRGSDPEAWNPASRFLLAGGGTLLLSAGLLAALHRFGGVPYPTGRTGLYLIPLFTLTTLALPESLGPDRRARLAAGVPLWLVSAAWLWHYAVHFQTRYYGEWLYDSSTKRIMAVLVARQRQHPRPVVRVGIHWMLEPSMNFYRRIWKLNWLAPLDRKGADGDFDAYVLLGENSALVETRNLRVLFADRVSGAIVAVPAGRGGGT